MVMNERVLEEVYRPAWAEIDLAALRDNVRTIAKYVAPSELCAVVKADGYGHSAVAVAESVLSCGATRLAVALVEEGMMLRRAGITAPILLLSEPSARSIAAAIGAGITPTVYTLDGVIAAHNAAASECRRVGVHLKIDTGMHRVGADPHDVLQLARAIVDGGDLILEGLWTHFALADDPDEAYTDAQIALFDATCDELAESGITAPVHHLANSAGSITYPQARRSWVRCGLALYGYLPSQKVKEHFAGTLRPVLSLKAQVGFVRPLRVGERPSYGRIAALEADGDVAVVPLGYADGVPRSLGAVGGEVLIGGRRRGIIGNITMDQFMVECGTSGEINVGDEVVLLGRQGREEITADDWAMLVGTVPYEILCAIGPRVPRVLLPASLT